MKKANPYEEYLTLPHPKSKTHTPMSRLNRAAQFAPFAALTGHEEAILETQRITKPKKQLSQGQKQEINEELNKLSDEIKTKPLVRVLYFEKDPIKEGGTTYEIGKRIKKIDEIKQVILFVDGTQIAFMDLYEIERIKEE